MPDGSPTGGASAYRVISDRADYTRAVETIAAGEGPIAVDAERASGFRYSQRAYLIQVFRRGAGVFLFDPPALGRFDDLQAVIGSEEWVLHAASQDLACLREVGLDPSTVFDTELGARLAGLPRVGLGAVVEELLGIHLAKEHSAADWSTRPLPSSWITYAALDVELLVDVRDALAEVLDEAGKSEIARQEFAAEVASAGRAPRADPWRRMSGLHGIRSPRNLAVARELWHARDDFARSSDTAPGRLVPDTALSAVARILPSSKHALAGMKEFTGRASRTELDRWWAAVERGRDTDELPPMRIPGDGLPPPRAWIDRNPEADRRLKSARPAVQAVADELRMPTENLLTPESLRRVAWSPPEPSDATGIGSALRALGARPWQVDATAPAIAKAFVEALQPVDDEVPEGS